MGNVEETINIIKMDNTSSANGLCNPMPISFLGFGSQIDNERQKMKMTERSEEIAPREGK